MQVTPNVRAVQVPDDNPMHPQYTTIYLVGRDQSLTIDSGEDFERYRWMLRGYLAAVEKSEIMLSAVTHHHADHSANLRWLQDEFGATIHALGGSAELLGDRLPPKGVQFVEEGDEILVTGDVRLQVMHTPGHSTDSVCYYLEDEGVLFTGDTILGASTTTINDLHDYMATLDRLRSLPNLKVMCPGHGPLIYNPIETIDDYIRRRTVREQEILDILAEGPEFTSWDMVERLYQDVDRRLWRAADRVVQTHLRKLEKEGAVKVYAGVPRMRSSEDAAREKQEEHERQQVILQAAEYEKQAKRRALGRQEAGPSLEWLEPPRYELNR